MTEFLKESNGRIKSIIPTGNQRELNFEGPSTEIH
jgi:hypothetical protein